ncbi:hypothetical protein EHP00_2698 [Ecytonucleospora hepatopenaei]|uniref:Uncharacterized protein n=1 Tax=Ecytonucleospora hepatopenaei TaxID=646526 RepID=A0A1W0E7R2_9MICR|nr:hypothetical protein EHP00_767 [Ecytonucleospora hepatopenaei]OQS55307.1 hypothetical protein EHP00_2698 [Ecytonucleospora hepatopenaei]
MLLLIVYILNIFNTLEKVKIERKTWIKLDILISELFVLQEKSLKQKRNHIDEPDTRLILKCISLTNALCEFKQALISNQIQYTRETYKSFTKAFNFVNEISLFLCYDYNSYYITRYMEYLQNKNNEDAGNKMNCLKFNLTMVIIHLENYVNEIKGLLDKYFFYFTGS